MDEHQETLGLGVTPRLEGTLALDSQDADDAKQSKSEEHNAELETAEQSPSATRALGSGGQGLTVDGKDGKASFDNDPKEEGPGWPFNRISPDAGDAGGYTLVQLPVSGASSVVIPGPSVLRTLPLGASLEQLMLEPKSIPLPS